MSNAPSRRWRRKIARRLFKRLRDLPISRIDREIEFDFIGRLPKHLRGNERPV
jgi:hypothetical protein